MSARFVQAIIAIFSAALLVACAGVAPAPPPVSPTSAAPEAPRAATTGVSEAGPALIANPRSAVAPAPAAPPSEPAGSADTPAPAAAPASEQLSEQLSKQPSSAAGRQYGSVEPAAQPTSTAPPESPASIDGAADGAAHGAADVVPASGPGRAAEDLSGKLALYYRVTFGSNAENLKAIIRDYPGGNGNNGVADITWTNSSKGIIRYIPETGRVDVMKTIASPSWAPSSIYPLTIGDRLFTIRDWGADWTVKNKRFSVDELDPVTGATLSSTDINSEWFTVVGDQVFFKSEVDDFWGAARGGQIKARQLGSGAEQKLAPQDARLGSVGGELVAWHDGQLRIHNQATGEVQTTAGVDPGLLEDLWPSHWPSRGKVFYGDESIYWARESGSPGEIEIIRMPLRGNPARLLSLGLEGWELGLVIDEHDGQVMIGAERSVPARGVAIAQVFLIDLNTGDAREAPIDLHIPASTWESGGGLQLLRLP